MTWNQDVVFNETISSTECYQIFTSAFFKIDLIQQRSESNQMYFISKLMRSKLGKKHNLLFFCIRTCVLRDGPLFSEGDGVRWEFGQFSKKLSCRAKLKKMPKKFIRSGNHGKKKIITISLIFISAVKNFSHQYSPPRNYTQSKSARKIMTQKIAQFTYSEKKICWFLEHRDKKVINTFAKSVYCVD